MSERSPPVYQNPLVDRYASREMVENFSRDRRYRTWRDLWIALAECEAELGLPITREQIEALRRRRDEIDFDRVATLEEELRHDVMAHIRHYGEQCPGAGGEGYLFGGWGSEEGGPPPRRDGPHPPLR